jgi:hypothetical protein
MLVRQYLDKCHTNLDFLKEWKLGICLTFMRISHSNFELLIN